METNLKKLISIFGVVCCGVTSLFAASNNDMSNSDYECIEKETCNKDCNCCASPRVQGGADVFIEADFILWVAREAGLGMATSGVPQSSQATQPSGKVSYPNHKIKPGFKVGLGLVLDHDCWDIYATYTWFRSNQKKKTITNTTEDMIALINPTPNSGLLTYATAVTGDWDLNFNNIDLSLGRNFWNSDYLSLRPHIGLKGSWQRQKFNLNYTVSSDEDDIRMKQNFWGVGVRAGLDTAYYLSSEFSIFGDFALAALWSQFKNKHNNRTRASGSDDAYRWNSYWKGDYHNVSPVLETEIGIRWDTWLSQEEYHFLIQAAWELQEWWSQNNFNNDYTNGVRGDLSLQGFTLKVRFDF